MDERYKILVTSTSEMLSRNNMFIVGRAHVKQTVIKCLEDPISHLLDRWMQDLGSVAPTNKTVRITKAIENIRKQMKLEETNDVSSTGSSNQHIVPENVKEYLYRYIFFVIVVMQLILR